MKKSFVLFRDGQRLRAAHVELVQESEPLYVKGRRFTLSGCFVHWSHIIDSQKRLLGFVLDPIEDASSAAGWREWWATFDNRHLIDFWQAYLFLAEPMPIGWREDCSLLIGGSVFADGAGDFVLVIPDDNGCCFRPNEPTVFWSEIGFDLQTHL